MKKIMAKAMCFALAVCAAATAFSGCGKEVIKTYDKTKTQLLVHSYSGGVGVEWLDKIARQFEADYAEVSFEPDKKGVEIVDSGSKNTVINTMSTADYAVYFAESVDYSTLVTGGKLLDITDVVKNPLSDLLGEHAENATIESKMYEGVRDALSFKNDKYYAIPHYSVFAAVTYNKKLFDDKGFYFADEVPVPDEGESLERADYFINKYNKVKSCGPDGKMKTDDDGLPATWDEFFMLCDYMDDNEVAPFFWAGHHPHYYNYLLNAVYLNLTGKDQASLKFTFDSKGKEVEIVDKFNDAGVLETSKVAITEDNYALLEKQLTKYQTLQIGERIYKTPEYRSSVAVVGDRCHLETQNEYIRSCNENNPIAFLIEGSYWYNESAIESYFDQAATDFGSKFAEKNEYAVMPLPRVYKGSAADVKGTAVGNTVVADQSDAYAFINANIADNENLVKLAKTFLRYCYTDGALKAFTEKTGVPRYLNYDVDSSKLPTSYAKSVWNMYKNSDMVVTASDNPLYLNNRLSCSYILTSSVWSSTNEAYFLSSMSKGLSAKDHFEAMWNKK